MVIDDERTARTELALLLARWGRVEEAESAQQGLTKIREAMAASDPYSLVCVDLCMPGEGGLEALNAIRDLDERSGTDRTEVVMVTSSDDKHDVIEAFRQQADAYLVKPVSAAKIEELVARLGGGEGQR
ncbi:MAG: PleD family two-component system response regulator [Planctomycetota bacterium]